MGEFSNQKIIQVYPAVVGEVFRWVPVEFGRTDVDESEWYFQSNPDEGSPWLRLDHEGFEITPIDRHEGGRYRIEIRLWGWGRKIKATSWPILGRLEGENLLAHEPWSSVFADLRLEIQEQKLLLKKIYEEKQLIREALSTEVRILELQKIESQVKHDRKQIWRAKNIEQREQALKSKEIELEQLELSLTQREKDLLSTQSIIKKQGQALENSIAVRKGELEAERRKLHEQIEAKSRELKEKYEAEKRVLENAVRKFKEDTDLQSKINNCEALREALEIELDAVKGLAALYPRMSAQGRARIHEIIESEKTTKRRNEESAARNRALREFGPDATWT
jgi:DNA repair exonuclease SbcCD ATPase subunit